MIPAPPTLTPAPMTSKEIARAAVKRACAGDSLGAKSIRNAVNSVYEDLALRYAEMAKTKRPDLGDSAAVEGISSLLVLDATEALIAHARKS